MESEKQRKERIRQMRMSTERVAACCRPEMREMTLECWLLPLPVLGVGK